MNSPDRFNLQSSDWNSLKDLDWNNKDSPNCNYLEFHYDLTGPAVQENSELQSCRFALGMSSASGMAISQCLMQVKFQLIRAGVCTLRRRT